MNRPQRYYQPGLDILRFFAFLMVFYSHAFYTLAQNTDQKINSFFSWINPIGVHMGMHGVDVFFCLSSFLITSLLLKEYRKNGRIQVISFYIRRILRIWPLYYSFLLLAIFVFPLFLSNENLPQEYRISFLGFFGNWTCALKGYPPSLVVPLWSVSVEEQFYLAWPLLLALVNFKRFNFLVISAVAAGLISNIWLVKLGSVDPGIWCNTLVRLEPIGIGALMALLLLDRPAPLTGVKRILLFIFGLFLLGVAVAICPTADGPLSPASFLIAALSSGILLLPSLGDLEGEPSLMMRILIRLGKISYGLYVFHILALALLDEFAPIPASHWQTILRAGLGLAITIILAETSYRFLESPFLKLKERFSFIKSGG